VELEKIEKTNSYAFVDYFGHVGAECETYQPTGNRPLAPSGLGRPLSNPIQSNPAPKCPTFEIMDGAVCT